ncbi:Uncharacterized membrane protein [Pedobacter terrae]|uniref:Uncharacterized membrane protein n=1 Tax=Pedobacter terrae TaxID=405671 RepID=A0A1G7VRR4_9SPHI|nr:DUF2254 domain-containing protein [Pedobacter terrae]SDG61590.1 Uncharacterized membrane protein [Pedobacter terrae]
MKVKVLVQNTLKSMDILYSKTISSIAFIPAIVALVFLFLSVFMVQFDYSESGKAIKSNSHWLTLKDASTARSIISTITGGIISLTVFSFSMVMILLNQAASQMSNRILEKLIGNRFQQIVLGFYIGTIVYALFLLSTIRDIDSGVYVPAISTYLLISFTVIDIFLFIYFLHYVTQSVKYETIIHKIFNDTQKSLEKKCVNRDVHEPSYPQLSATIIYASKSGIYQGFMEKPLLALCSRENLVIRTEWPSGTMIIKNTPVLSVLNKNEISEDLREEMTGLINIHGGQNIDTNYYYGFRQLMEVAVKALSPGINDPGTAILSLQALGNLLKIRSEHYPKHEIVDQDKVARILVKERTLEEIFADCIYPIWDYGKQDRLVTMEMHHILVLLCIHTTIPVFHKMLDEVKRSEMYQDLNLDVK